MASALTGIINLYLLPVPRPTTFYWATFPIAIVLQTISSFLGVAVKFVLTQTFHYYRRLLCLYVTI